MGHSQATSQPSWVSRRAGRSALCTRAALSRSRSRAWRSSLERHSKQTLTVGSIPSKSSSIATWQTALRRAAGLPLPELLASCRDDMEHFLGGAARPDDLTLVAVRRVA